MIVVLEGSNYTIAMADNLFQLNNARMQNVRREASLPKWGRPLKRQTQGSTEHVSGFVLVFL